MPTDIRKEVKTVEEYKEGASFTYAPVVLAIQTKKKYEATGVDQAKFKKFDIETDSVRAEILTAEQTEKAHIKGKTSSRVFNIYTAGAKFIKSFMNGDGGIPQGFHDKVLREYSKIFDRWGLGGDRGNNGLLVSSDPDYVTNASANIPVPGADNWDDIDALSNLMTALKLQVDSETASQNLLIYLYGDKLITLWNKVTKENETVVSTIMKEKWSGKTATFIEIPKLVIPSVMANENGFVIVSNDIASLDYVNAPELMKQGQNDEDDYYWANYALGSLQVNAEEHGGIIKQPLTIA